MKPPISKARQKKKQMMIYIIIGAIAYIYAVLVYGHTCAIMFEDKRLSIGDAINLAMTDVFTNPTHILLGGDYFIFLFLGSFTLAYFIFMKVMDKSLRKHDNPDTVNGEAHFMDENELKEFNKAKNEPFGKPESDGKGNMILTKDLKMSLDGYKTRRNCNVLAIGGSGAGKTRYFVGPNILQANCNYIVTDPSGELLSDYGKFLEDRGYDVKVFNLTDVYKSNHYNPFEYIRSEKDVFTLVETFIRNTTPDGKNGGDPFWENSEKLLLTALILYLWHTAPKKDQTFSKVVQLVSMANIDENGDSSESSPLDILFEDLEREDPQNLAVAQYKKFKLGAGKTLKSILISVGVRMQSFDLSDIKYLTNTDDFELDSFGDTKRAIFVIIPTADKTFNFLVSMFYSQIFATLYSYCENNAQYGWRVDHGSDTLKVFHAQSAEDSPNAKAAAEDFVKRINDGCYIKYNKQKRLYDIFTKKGKELVTWRGTKNSAINCVNSLKNLKVTPYGKKSPSPLRYHTRFLLDEFANIGQIPTFNEKLATVRKYSISCSIILQALSQIKALYKDDYNTIVANCDSALFLGSADMETIKWIIEKFGKKTTTVQNTSWSAKTSGSTSYNKSSIELMTADQIQMMDDSEAVALIRGEHPYYGKKYDLLAHPNFKESDAKAGTFIIPITGDVEFKPTGRFSERNKNAEPIPVTESVETPKKNNTQKNSADSPDKIKNRVMKEKAKGNDEKLEAYENEKLEKASEMAEKSLLETFGIELDDNEVSIAEKVESLIDLSDPPLESLLFASTQ